MTVIEICVFCLQKETVFGTVCALKLKTTPLTGENSSERFRIRAGK